MRRRRASSPAPHPADLAIKLRHAAERDARARAEHERIRRTQLAVAALKLAQLRAVHVLGQAFVTGHRDLFGLDELLGEREESRA